MSFFRILIGLSVCCAVCLDSVGQTQLSADITTPPEMEYPEQRAIVSVRDPDGVDSLDLVVSENDSALTLTRFKEIKAGVKSTGKCVLVLFENHRFDSRNPQRRFFKELISNTAVDVVGAEDEFYFASFDWDRDELNGKYLFHASESSSSNAQDLIDWSAAVQPKRSGADYKESRGTELYPAVVEAISFLDAMDTDEPKCVVVLSSAFPNLFNPKEDESDVINAAKKANIPVYSIDYLYGSRYNFKGLAEKTHGLSELFEQDQSDEAENAFVDFMSKVESRALGKKYEIEFATSHPKDGQTHRTNIEANGESGELNFTTQSPNIMDWINNNPLFAGILGGVGLLVLILIVVLIRKSSKEKERKEREARARMEQVEEENRLASEKISKQDDAMRHREERERIQQEKALAEEQEAARKNKENELIERMKQGGLPRLSGEFQGVKAELLLDKPVVTIGRKESNYYHIKHNTVSGNHAEIRFADDKYILVDLNSSNGTLVNGRKISEQVLKHGDVVQFGQIDLTYLK
jgi:hypothetical protein